MALSDLLEKNRRWAAAQLAREPDFFSRHETGQHPRFLAIGCSDSRVPIEEVLDLGPGEVFVHRNVANIVAYNDINISAVIEYALTVLKVPDIVVFGHDGCGGIRAACQERLPASYVGDWLMIAQRSKVRVDQRLGERGQARPAEDAYLRLVVEQNVRLQLEHLAHLTVVRRQWEETPGIPRLHGWVYDLHTGLVHALDPEDH